MKDLISIIVPVYNAGSYLHNCIQSVLQQTYQHFELILVDDESQDGSKLICENMSHTDKRVHFVSQRHQGVSAARNTALRIAQGEYLFFLDSDDILHPCLLEILSTILTNTHASLAVAEYQFITDNDSLRVTKQRTIHQYFSDYIYLDNHITLDMFTQGYSNLLYGTGGIMIRRSDIKGLLFDETLLIGEDTKFIYQLLLQGADVIILNKAWYYYRKHKDNSSKKRTIESWKSIYKCGCYIRDNELKNNRFTNATKQEFILLNRMREWYLTGKKSNDIRLCDYLKKLANKEFASKIFLQTNWQIKLRYIFAFYCHPLYILLLTVSNLYYSFVNVLAGYKSTH